MGVLKQHAIFGAMEPRLLNEIAVAMRLAAVKSGDSIIRQGEGGDAFYVVAEGSLSAYVADVKKGTEEKVHDYSTGDSFGELALMYDCPRAASVRANTHAVLYKLGRIAFRNLVSAAM